MKRKILSLMLAALMVVTACIGVSATEISEPQASTAILVYGMEKGFTVTIPAVIDNWTDDNSAVFSVSATDVVIDSRETLRVVISGDDYVNSWELIDSADSANQLTYTIGSTEGGSDIVNNSVILSVASGEAYKETVENSYYVTVIDEVAKSGTYQDTLTFTVDILRELAQDENDNYLVSTAADLFTLASIVNSGEWVNEDVTVLMTNNIDLKNEPFTPIGSYKVVGETSAWFTGTFDGQGYTIYNLNVTATDEATNINSTAGLFGAINGATIKNVNVDGATITGTHFTGVIVGALAPKVKGSASYVQDCNVINATVINNYYDDDNSGDKAGVVVGAATDSYVTNCTATDSTVTASRDAGQVVGSGFTNLVTGCSADNVTVSWNGTGANTNIRNEVIGRVLVAS